MTYRVAINGFGRIGRDFLRCVLERGLLGRGLDVVGINDLWDAATLAHLLEFDSTFGPLRWDVSHDDGGFTVGGHRIPVTGLRDPATLGWGELSVDLVIEATGKLRGRDDAAAHLKAGAKRVLISAPGKNVDATLVVGVNEDIYDPVRHEILSAASSIFWKSKARASTASTSSRLRPSCLKKSSISTNPSTNFAKQKSREAISLP